jgi:hypothetical protein
MGICNPKVLGPKLQPIIPALALAAVLGASASPALAMSYPAGSYQLTLSPPGTYPSETGQTSGGGCTGTPGMGGTCPYIPADFAHSDVENSGNGTTYNFYFTVGSGSTDYLNVSAPSTGTLEGFHVSTFTYTGSPAPSTPVSGPVLINDSTGISLAFTAGASAVNYYVVLNLYCGDTSACNAGGDDIDPTNDISDTGTADYAVVSATPLPAALPMMAGGLGFLSFLSRCRKRKTATA